MYSNFYAIKCVSPILGNLNRKMERHLYFNVQNVENKFGAWICSLCHEKWGSNIREFILMYKILKMQLWVKMYGNIVFY